MIALKNVMLHRIILTINSKIGFIALHVYSKNYFYGYESKLYMLDTIVAIQLCNKKNAWRNALCGELCFVVNLICLNISDFHKFLQLFTFLCVFRDFYYSYKTILRIATSLKINYWFVCLGSGLSKCDWSQLLILNEYTYYIRGENIWFYFHLLV